MSRIKLTVPVLLLFLLCPLFLSGCGDVDGYDSCYSCDDDYYYYDDDRLLAVDDLYETDADTTIFVNAPNGVLVNDYFYDAFIEFPETSVRGGVVVGNSDGSFTYTPPPAFAGTDAFEYELSDSFSSSVATVTIIINATNPGAGPGFVVDSASGNDATGNPATGAPFATLAGALSRAGGNAQIIVRPGNGQPYAGNITLLNGQQLIGAGFENVNPQTQTPSVTLSGTVTLADNNVVRGISFVDVNGDAINGDGSQGGVVSHCAFNGSTGGGRAVSAEDARGSWTIVGNSISRMDDAGIRLTSAGSASLSARIADNAISNCRLSAISLLSENTSTFTTSVRNNTMSGNDLDYTFDILALDGSTVRLDLEGNRNDGVYYLSTLSFNGSFGVENLATLQARNLSGTVVLDEAAGSSPITELPDGSVDL